MPKQKEPEREPGMTIRELKTHVDTRFAEVNREFATLEKRLAAEHAKTRRHFDVVAERLEGHLKLFAERGDADHEQIENHEKRITALEEHRR